MTTFKVNVNGQIATVEVTRQGNTLHVVHDNKSVELRLIHEDGPFIVLEQIQPDGSRRIIRTAGHADGDPSASSGQARRQIWVDGRTFTYHRVRPQTRSTTGPDTGSLSASIPAVVAEVLVSVGETVAAGDKLILLESMKMVIPIQAPYDGAVTKINCTAGESVQAGVPLIEIEEIGD
jgi:3-methylcrotonyl-CoA carboxylase alpha subunit